MIRKLPVRIAAATAGLVLAGGAAVAAAGSPPEAAGDGLTTAEEHTGFAVPVGHEDADALEADDVEVDDEAAEDEATEVEATESEGVGPVDNHGAEVSAVAHTDFETGREHGEAVSEVARGDHGPDAEADAAEELSQP